MPRSLSTSHTESSFNSIPKANEAKLPAETIHKKVATEVPLATLWQECLDSSLLLRSTGDRPSHAGTNTVHTIYALSGVDAYCFKESSEEKERLILSEAYAQANEQERREYLEQLTQDAQLMTDVVNAELNVENPNPLLIPTQHLQDPDHAGELGYIGEDDLVDDNEEDYMGDMLDEEFDPENNI